MHYHLEIVMPPVADIAAAVDTILKPYCEHGDDGDEERLEKHAFWDFHVIGGRWAGSKLLAEIDSTKLDAFYAWLKEEHVTVSGLQCGKQELSPADQIPKVDAKWSEMFPEAAGPCPLFNHSNSQYGEGLKGAMRGDVCKLSELPADLKCSRILIAKPSYDTVTKGYHGPLEAEFMLCEDAWNGCNHMKVDWDGKASSALAQYCERIKSYREEFRAIAEPQPNWLVVTVDYHS